MVESDLVSELAFAQEQLNMYGSSNESLAEFYRGEIERILAAMEAEGITSNESDGTSSTTLPVTQYAIHVYIDPMIAEAGRIDVRADVLTGSGTLDAPGDASVNIINHTPAFLVIEGIYTPETTGGLYLNGAPKTTLAEIDASNTALMNEDNSRTGPGDAFFTASAPAFTEPLPNGTGTAEPWIYIFNDFTAGHVGPDETYLWPDITVTGDVINMGGLVHLETNQAGEGDINIYAEVRAGTLEIVAGGTTFIDLRDIPESKFNTGCEPDTVWGEITRGVVCRETHRARCTKASDRPTTPMTTASSTKMTAI